MKIIVGLGNPNKQYLKTRHNVGFMVVDYLAKQLGIEFKNKSTFNAFVGEAIINNQKVILVKPLTFMNLSGLAVVKIMEYYRCEYSDLLVVSDDVALAVGSLRLRSNGGHGGHNGLRNIIVQTGQQDFKRLRIGIDQNKDVPLEHYVLSDFSKSEQTKITDVIKQAVSAIDDWILTDNFEIVMTNYNTKA